MTESESDKGDKGGKDEVASGMTEAGKDRAKAGEGTKGPPGKGADPAKLTEGMSEAGSGVPTGGEGAEDEAAGAKP